MSPEPSRDSHNSAKDSVHAADRHPILDHDPASAAVEGDMPSSSATRSATASVSAGIAAANNHLPKSADQHYSGEDGRRSLAEIAEMDLDAALQLLAERAHYITGASGAAIALRRGEHKDMLCRASAGTNAPALGALLSMDYGLSGESVRTRQVLRCDDAERDPRVNHEVCRQLGIASVVVLPIVSDEQVLGVFEILSGKTRAFDERDLSALRRLSDMVEIAVNHAVAAQTLPAHTTADVQKAELPAEEPLATAPVIAPSAVPVPLPDSRIDPDVVPPSPAKDLQPQELVTLPESIKTDSGNTPEPAPKKPLFWSAAMQVQSGAGRSEATESTTVPPGLRTLQKCQACGFPVSQGRTFCVECEEKQWRGQRLPQPVAGATQPAQQQAASQVIRRPENNPPISLANDVSSAQLTEPPKSDLAIASATRAPESLITDSIQLKAPAPQSSEASSSDIPINRPHTVPQPLPQNAPADVSGFDNSAPFLSSAVESQSWFSANKYILGTLLAVAIIIGVIVLMR
jgi:hypothetical protein